MPVKTVVLVHGLAANTLMLKPIERHLQKDGYRTINWGYPSILRDIQWHAQKLSKLLTDLEQDPNTSELQLVTHSMGGIVTRTALLSTQLPKARRLVMLSPPNHGSRVAAFLSRGLGWCCRPLTQLDHSDSSFVNSLPPPVGIQVGIIAASRDRVVSIESTRLVSATDHWVVPSGHNSMLFRRDVALNVSYFLRHGNFQVEHEWQENDPHASQPAMAAKP